MGSIRNRCQFPAFDLDRCRIPQFTRQKRFCCDFRTVKKDLQYKVAACFNVSKRNGNAKACIFFLRIDNRVGPREKSGTARRCNGRRRLIQNGLNFICSCGNLVFESCRRKTCWVKTSIFHIIRQIFHGNDLRLNNRGQCGRAGCIGHQSVHRLIDIGERL